MALNTITPVARLELFLQDIADGNETPSETPVSRPEEFLRRIAKSNGEQDAALEHISDQIPIDPTAADVGKVMTVIEDTSGETPVYKWSAESAQGGGGTFYVTGTLNNDRWVLNASYQNIADAIADGKTVIGVFDDSDTGYTKTQYRQLVSITAFADEYQALFASTTGSFQFTAATATANLIELI